MSIAVEHLIPEFLDERLPKIQSPFFLRRLQFGGKRFYYEVDQELNVTIFLSSTTFIKAVLPENKFLTGWRIDMALLKGSEEASDEYVELTANYGTLMHVCIGHVVKTGRFVDQEIRELVIETILNLKIDQEEYMQLWMDNIMLDMLAFLQFVSEYEVKILAIEFPIKMGEIATCIDMVCEITTKEKGFWGEVYATDCKGGKKGDPKETYRLNTFVAIVDFKSGRKGFYPANEFQLELCKEAWNQFFSGTPYEVTKVFNWAPNDWRDIPTFKLKDQSDSKFKGAAPTFFKVGEILGIFNFRKSRKKVTGQVVLGHSPVDAYQIQSLEESIVEYEKSRLENSKNDANA